MKKNLQKIIIAFLVITMIGTGVALYNIFKVDKSYKDIEIRNNDGVIQYKSKQAKNWNDLVLVDTVKGKDGREIEIKKEDNFVKWKYVGEDAWTNLIDLKQLIGQDGKNGKNGFDGREIELETDNEYIKYRYKGEKNWTNLIKLSSINTGSKDNDKEIEIENDGTYIKWRYKGDTTWINLATLDSLKGNDGASGNNGREIEIENDGTYIKWRYKGDTTWINLTTIESLKGMSGIDGDMIELESDGTYIKWKYKNSLDWTNLISLDSLKGEDGGKWINLGVVETEDYCKTYNEGNDDEYDTCGYYGYIGEHFPNALEGNYIFIDSEDGFTHHVEVTKSDDESGKKALIEYWSSEEVYPYYIQAWYDVENDNWATYELKFVDYNALNYYVNDLKSLISKLDWVDLGTVDTMSYINEDEGFLGYYEYIKQYFPKQKEGRYKFTDNEDYFVWHVEVETSTEENSNAKKVLLKFWSSEDVFPCYYQAYDWENDGVFDDVYEINYTTYDQHKFDVDQLRNLIYTGGWKYLGVVDVSTGCPSNEYCPVYYIKNKLMTEGKYVFLDNEDRFTFHVTVEMSTFTNRNKVAIVNYWSSEDQMYFTIVGRYTYNTKKWTWDEESRSATYDEMINVKENLTLSITDLQTKYNQLVIENESLKTRIKNLEVEDIGIAEYPLTCDSDGRNCKYGAGIIKIFEEYNNLREGRYKFVDEQENYVWFVNIEKYESEYDQIVLITYAYSDDPRLNYVMAKDYGKTGEWTSIEEYSLATYDELSYYLERLGEFGVKDIYINNRDTSNDHLARIKKYFNNISVIKRYSEYDFYRSSGTGDHSSVILAYPKKFVDKVYIEYRVTDDPSILYYMTGTYSSDGTITWGEVKSK